jgi:hypothetical protein
VQLLVEERTMRHPRSVGTRIALCAAVVIGILTLGFVAAGSIAAPVETVYAIDATPSPTLTPAPFTTGTPTPTPTLQPGVATLVPTTTLPTTASSAGQQASEQIGVVSQQVAQTLQDPSLTTDAKVQRITTLAAQFNQLVAQWQQQVNQTLSQVAVAGVQATPGAVAATPTPGAVAATPTPVPTATRR